MTAIPSKASFNGASVTEGQYKAALELLHDYLTQQLGSDGSLQSFALPQNLSLAASVAGNALTISLKNKAGADPSAASPILIPFRNSTANLGDISVLAIEAATSIVVSSGSTLGTVNAVPARLWIVGFNDAGTFRLGLINCRNPTGNAIFRLRDDQVQSSTAEGGAGAADSAHVIYTGTAVSAKSMRVLGYVEITETTAGTWATAHTKLQIMGPSVPMPGEVVTEAIDIDSTQVATTSNSDTATNLSIAITLKDSCNVVEIDTFTAGQAVANAQSGVTSTWKIKRGANTLATSKIFCQGNGSTASWGSASSMYMSVRELVPAVGSATYDLTMNVDGASTVTAQVGNFNGRIHAKELMA